MNFSILKNLIKKIYLKVLESIVSVVIKSKNFLIQQNIIKSYKIKNDDYGYFKYRKEEMEKSYQTFKKYFYKSVFLDSFKIRRYAISEATKNETDKDYFLEFGVYKATSLNYFSQFIKKNKIYGFDSFEGLNYSWSGHTEEIGHKNLKKELPKVNKNVILIPGWIEETLQKFIDDKPDFSVKFVHIDTDTYESTNFIFKKIKPYLQDNCIILFDELYNYAGWSMGEYKALTENFSEKEYEFFAFGLTGKQAAIRYKKMK